MAGKTEWSNCDCAVRLAAKGKPVVMVKRLPQIVPGFKDDLRDLMRNVEPESSRQKRLQTLLLTEYIPQRARDDITPRSADVGARPA
jgi:hypothetical protein